jgi:hypothetical protein
MHDLKMSLADEGVSTRTGERRFCSHQDLSIETQITRKNNPIAEDFVWTLIYGLKR